MLSPLFFSIFVKIDVKKKEFERKLWNTGKDSKANEGSIGREIGAIKTKKSPSVGHGGLRERKREKGSSSLGILSRGRNYIFFPRLLTQPTLVRRLSWKRNKPRATARAWFLPLKCAPMWHSTYFFSPFWSRTKGSLARNEILLCDEPLTLGSHFFSR